MPVVAQLGELRQSAANPFFEAQAALSPVVQYVAGAMQTLSNEGQILQQALAEKKRRLRKAYVFGLCTLALLLAGCAGIDRNQLATQVGSFDQPGSQNFVTNSGVELDFVYSSAGLPFATQALGSGYQQSDIDTVLAQVDQQVGIGSQTNGAGGNVARRNASPEQQKGLTTPYHLSVHPVADGAYDVAVGGRECFKDGSACTPQTGFTVHVVYDATPPNVSLQLQQVGTDVVATAATSDNFTGVQALSVYPCGNPGAPYQLTPKPDNSGYAATVPVGPGTTCVEATAQDKAGNVASTQQQFQYVLGVSAEGQVTSLGSFHVEGAASSNLYPISGVTIQSCFEGVPPAPVVVQPDGHFSYDSPAKPGVNCERAVVQDVKGNAVASNEVRGDYQLTLGQVFSDIQIGSPGAEIILYGNPPDNMNPATASGHGTQPDWRQFGAVVDVNCDTLPSGTTYQGQVWKMIISCKAPANAGDAQVSIDLVDANGYRLSEYSPGAGNFIIDLPEKPPLEDAVKFYGPLALAALAGLAGAGTLAGFAARGAWRMSHASVIDELCEANRFKDAREQLPHLKNDPDFRARMDVRIRKYQYVATQKRVAADLQGAQSVDRSKKQQWTSTMVTNLGILLHNYPEAEKPAIKKRRTDEILHAINTFKPYLREAVQHLKQFGTLDALLQAYRYAGPERKGMESLIQSLAEIQTQGHNDDYWHALTDGDIELARDLRELSVLYAASKDMMSPHTRRRLSHSLTAIDGEAHPESELVDILFSWKAPKKAARLAGDLGEEDRIRCIGPCLEYRQTETAMELIRGLRPRDRLVIAPILLEHDLVEEYAGLIPFFTHAGDKRIMNQRLAAHMYAQAKLTLNEDKRLHNRAVQEWVETYCRTHKLPDELIGMAAEIVFNAFLADNLEDM